MKTLGDKIRYCRKLKDWTQENMADNLKITLGAYSKIERNITDVHYSRLKQIAKVLGMTVGELESISSKPITKNKYEKIIADKDREIFQLQKKVIALLDKKK